jgi:hypothetical protein
MIWRGKAFPQSQSTEAHRHYTRFINARHRQTVHLWQGRFGAAVMDEEYLGYAMRSVSDLLKDGDYALQQSWCKAETPK